MTVTLEQIDRRLTRAINDRDHATDTKRQQTAAELIDRLLDRRHTMTR